MNWAETTRQGIEKWFTGEGKDAGPTWSQRIGTWLLDRIASGITKSLEDMEPGALAPIKDIVDSLKENPDVPDEIKDFLSNATTPGNPLIVIAALLMISGVAQGFIMAVFAPVFRALEYKADRAVESFRLDPLSIITAWRRDPEKYASLFDDLEEKGWSDFKIEALKVFTLFYPSPRDLIGFMAHEVFEDPLAARYGLDAEIGEVLKHLNVFEKAGMKEEQIRQYWRDHWEHASFLQVVEMLHRGVLTETNTPPPTTAAGWDIRDAEGSELMRDWFKLVEIPPFWRDKLEAISWNVPTRVDVRRWWDMRVITEEELRNIYHRQGYHGDDLDNYVTWTKVYTEFPSLLARWSKGWITTEELRRQTLALGMPAERVDTFLQEKIEADQPERTATERDITKTDIYKGVKQERISRIQGLELLQDLGYDPDEADYLLSINIPEDEVESVAQNRLLTKADIIAGLRTEVIDEAAARDRLLGLRYSAVDTQLLLDIFKASITPPTEARLKEASKADIVKAVKKGLITPEEGYLMLTDIGYTPEASDFILFVNVEESPFSPVTFGEFKDLTTKYRRATKLTTRAEDDRLREAGAALVRITDEIKLLEDQVKVERGKIVDPETAPAGATARLDEINVSLNRARSERDRLQNVYNTLAAEYTQKNAD